MRYVKKAAQQEIKDYYNYCFEKFEECMDKGNEFAAENWCGKLRAIEKIREIVKKYGYTMD